MECVLRSQNATKYVPTEFLKGGCVEQSDLWSLGMSMAEMIGCQTFSLSSKWSFDMVDFMNCCVATNAKDRPSLRDIMLVWFGEPRVMHSIPSSESQFSALIASDAPSFSTQSTANCRLMAMQRQSRVFHQTRTRCFALQSLHADHRWLKASCRVSTRLW